MGSTYFKIPYEIFIKLNCFFINSFLIQILKNQIQYQIKKTPNKVFLFVFNRYFYKFPNIHVWNYCFYLFFLYINSNALLFFSKNCLIKLKRIFIWLKQQFNKISAFKKLLIFFQNLYKNKIYYVLLCPWNLNFF